MSRSRSKAYSYLRFSTPEQAGGDSLKRQMEKAEAYADEHDLDLDTSLSFKDLGVSAYTGKNVQTGALGYFLRAVEDGLIPAGSFLLVESLDRISRENILRAQAVFISIVDAGVTLVTLTDGRRFSKASINANPTDLIISIVSLMRAHEESATKALRLRSAWAGKRSRAAIVPMTARGPAWLKLRNNQWEVVEESGRPPPGGPGQILVHERSLRQRWRGRRSWSGWRSGPLQDVRCRRAVAQ
jgi:DNA invertase Pin-like site-specific DNA recombinase